MPHLLAVDANSLAHRAYHALAAEGIGGAFVTGGVVRMLATAWIEGPYDGVLFALDGPGNRRKALFPGYKAHRDDKDAALVEHLTALAEHLAACGFVVERQPGVEADDLLAAAADACVRLGWRCDVLSSDRDLVALVSDRVRLLRPRATMADLRVYDPARVEAEFGVRPEQYTDLAALRGDPSDGLDGVKGVGAKTAARLLRDHGDVPGVYAQLCNLPPRLEALLRRGRESVERNLLLMAPLPNLEVDVAGAVERGIDPARVRSVLAPVGAGLAADRLRGAIERPPLPPLPPPPDHDTADPAALDPAVAAPPTPRPARSVVVIPDDAEQPQLF